jgi:hypothetical protein
LIAHARAYMRVLRSLRIGGAYAYAPVLPFVEALLPASEYRRDRITLPSELIIPSLLVAREATRIDLGRATVVRRTA